MTPEEKQNQEEQKVSELLKPRYKVIADYPKSEFRIGDILEAFPDPADKWLNLRLQRTHNVEVGMYPHLFQKLEWWMDREVSEMPGYVSYVSLTLKDKFYGKKHKDLGDDFNKARIFHKVKKWSFFKGKFENREQWHYQCFVNDYWYEIFHSSLPATSDQYTSFINSKK